MTTSLLKVAVAGVVSAFVLATGCNKEKTGGATPTATVPSSGDLPPNTVVATYGDKKITAGELDQQVGEQMQQLEDQKFQLRKQGLEQLVVKNLVKEEAAKKGLTEEQYLKQEIDDKVPPPSDEEVKKMFEQNQAQLPPGAKLEEYKDRIADFISRPARQERAKKLFDELRKNANVQVLLKEPAKPRKQVEAKGPSRGPENAKVTIVEFSDFQCPFCGRAAATVDEVMQSYAGKVRLVFRQFPLDFHKEAPKAAEASLCANDQGKFWEMHDVLFKNQQALQVEKLKEHATSVGLDAAKFNECLDSGKYAKTVKEDMEAGQKAGVSGTPAFFINGVMLSGAQPAEEFKKVIDAELATN